MRKQVIQFSLMEKLSKYLQKNQALAMLTLRLIPIFPFWFMNIAPSILGISSSTFIWTTYVGIIPGSWVYTETGRGLDIALDSDNVNSIWSFLVTAMYRKSMLSSVGVLICWIFFLFGLKRFIDAREKSKSS